MRRLRPGASALRGIAAAALSGAAALALLTTTAGAEQAASSEQGDPVPPLVRSTAPNPNAPQPTAAGAPLGDAPPPDAPPDHASPADASQDVAAPGEAAREAQGPDGGASVPDTGDTVAIAVVDLVVIRRDAAAARSMAQQLESYVVDYQRDIEADEAALRDAQQQLESRQETLSAGAYAQERRRWELDVAQAQQRFQERRRALDQARAAAWQTVDQTLVRLIRDIAAERKLKVVLHREQTVYAASALDITEEVLRRLDRTLPTVQLAPSDG
jgi:Skp family chaperone for outer membrane proteins